MSTPGVADPPSAVLEALSALGFDAAAQSRLQALVSLVTQAQQALNLVAPDTVPHLWYRHVLDSAQLLPEVSRETVLDLGSGGGFPALVVACAQIPVLAVESDTRKATFLAVTARRLSLPVQVRAERIDAVTPPVPSVVTARALAPLVTLLHYQARLGAYATRGVYLKGAAWRQELDHARARFGFTLRHLPSLTDPRGAILEIRDVAPLPS